MNAKGGREAFVAWSENFSAAAKGFRLARACIEMGAHWHWHWQPLHWPQGTQGLHRHWWLWHWLLLMEAMAMGCGAAGARRDSPSAATAAATTIMGIADVGGRAVGGRIQLAGGMYENGPLVLPQIVLSTKRIHGQHA